MTRDDMIRLAHEAGWGYANNQDGYDPLWKFGELVAAAEREKVARWQIGSGYTTGHGETIEDLLVELEWQVRESEREACAKVCDELVLDQYSARGCAAAIRARGQHD